MKATRRNAGFALPVVLGIILIAALVSVDAATELGSTTLLSTQRQLHQRALEAAESGIVTAMEQLASRSEPAGAPTLRTHGSPADAATVNTSITSLVVPPGFSTDRVIEKHYEIRSTGFSARGSEVTVVQGARQLQTAAP